MRWLFLVLLLSGCVYTPEKKVATEYILRPNGDGATTEWDGTFADINEDVGELGDITSVDTARLASWGVTTTPWLDMETGGMSGISVGPPGGVTHKAQDVLWEDYPGSSADRIESLSFRYATFSFSIGGEPLTYLDVYINSELIESVSMDVPVNSPSVVPYSVYVREDEVVLPRLYTKAEIATLETKLRSGSTGAGTWIYAMECHTRTSEKDAEKDINPADGGEKEINTYVSIEKP